MKNILISMRNLQIGGIEKSAIELTDYLLQKGYNITLVLEEKKGELLKQINDKIEIIEYNPSKLNIKIFRKFINCLKRIKFIIQYKNKFEVSISYTTYSKVGSFVARIASKNSILWSHADYLELFGGNATKVKEFFKQIHYNEFSKIVFVSKSANKSFLDVFPNKENTYFCNNLIDSKKIYEKAKENIDIEYNNKIPTFLNIGRHDEKQKKLTRIIEAAKMLKENNYTFRIVFIGDGQDKKRYEQLVIKYNLENNIIFAGAKENPYPYYKIANCIILSSDYEGYPVVFLESYLFNKPIITTNVSDYEDISNGRGIVTDKNIESIYIAMKYFLDNGYKIKREFDAQNYNLNVKGKISEILEKF